MQRDGSNATDCTVSYFLSYCNEDRNYTVAPARGFPALQGHLTAWNLISFIKTEMKGMHEKGDAVIFA